MLLKEGALFFTNVDDRRPRVHSSLVTLWISSALQKLLRVLGTALWIPRFAAVSTLRFSLLRFITASDFEFLRVREVISVVYSFIVIVSVGNRLGLFSSPRRQQF